MATNTGQGSRQGNRRGTARSNKGSDRNTATRTRGVRDNPLAAAAAVGGAVAAGLFLWSRRNQISDQISDLAEQISDWRENSGSSGSSAAYDSDDEEADDGQIEDSGSSADDDGRTQVDIAHEALALKEGRQAG
jgi:hypothetical protein